MVTFNLTAGSNITAGGINTTDPALSESEWLRAFTGQKGMGDVALWQTGGWNLLAEELELPVAVLNAKALQQNLAWMQQFAAKAGVQLAPHGKTGMLPALFQQQMAHGAWGITLATMAQVQVAAAAGVPRVLLANPLVGLRAMQQAAALQQQGLAFYCLVDSVSQVQALETFFAACGQQLKVLIEVGVAGGRAGVRSHQAALALAQYIQQCQHVQLVGLEFYEGVVKAPATELAREVRRFVDACIALTLQLQQQQLFASEQIILTGAGSAWYDVVAEAFACARLPEQILPLIRPGCYLFFDLGMYQQKQQQVLARSALACQVDGALQNALEVWAYVLSRPEPGLAVVGLGKRDIAFDAGLALVCQHYRPGTAAPQQADPSWRLVKMMDQHALLQLPSDADVAVGDMLSFAGSHPCLTLDKWRYVAVLDADYQVRQLYPTYF